MLCIATCASACVHRSTRVALEDVARLAQMNTIATTIFYIGSDSDYDYFYLDKPFGLNERRKVPLSEMTITNRMNRTHNPSEWKPFTRTSYKNDPTNQIVLHNGTNILIIMKQEEIQKAEPAL